MQKATHKAGRRTGRLAMVGVSTLGLIGGVALYSASGAVAQLPEGQAYSYTGAAAAYVVPGNVCAVQIVAAGGQGGTWGMEDEEEGEVEGPSRAPQAGGLGGVATSTITVTPGESLQVNVGGAGHDGIGGNTTPDDGTGGWNGGGDGGTGAGGGGGGASDVRQGGTGLTDRVVIGGGGGGVGVDQDTDMAAEGFGIPGVGGNPATPGGDEINDSDGTDYTPATGGGAGTQSTGGPAGQGFAFANLPQGDGPQFGPDGQAGTLGIGGAGATEPESSIGGGGGGGGLYGGGGGGIGFAEADGSGGGGSSLGDTTQPGARAGNGEVTITPVAECDTPTSSTSTSTSTTMPASTTSTTVAPSVAPKAATPVAAQPDYTG